MPATRESVAILRGAALIVRLNCFVAVKCVGVVESVTRTVKLLAPAVVGVPEIAPLLRASPAGRLPESSDHV
jgi:hypothetical protein